MLVVVGEAVGEAGVEVEAGVEAEAGAEAEAADSHSISDKRLIFHPCH